MNVLYGELTPNATLSSSVLRRLQKQDDDDMMMMMLMINDTVSLERLLVQWPSCISHSHGKCPDRKRHFCRTESSSWNCTAVPWTARASTQSSG